MRTLFVFVDDLPPPLDGEERGPDDIVVIRPEYPNGEEGVGHGGEEEGRLVLYMKTGSAENDLARELSYAVTMHAREEWVYVGGVLEDSV